MSEQLLEPWGIKPTPNRLLVAKALRDASCPQSLIELETMLETLDRSSISRVLALFKAHGMLHEMEDGHGVAKYELCRHCHNHEAKHTDETGAAITCLVDSDLHPHFYCEKCERVYCFDELTIPMVDVPQEFKVTNINYMLKGICPNCK